MVFNLLRESIGQASYPTSLTCAENQTDPLPEFRGVLSKAVTLAVLKAHLGIFSVDGSGSGQPAVLNEDGSLNSSTNPAKRGSTISIFATGGGVTNPATADGSIVGSPPPKLTAAVRVYYPLPGEPFSQTEDIEAEVSYAGALPGLVGGLVQVNAILPEPLPIGYVPLVLAVGDGEGSPQSNAVTVSLR